MHYSFFAKAPKKAKTDDGSDGTGQGQPESSVLSVDEINKFRATFTSDAPIAESSSSIRSVGNGIKIPLRSTIHKDIPINIKKNH